MANRLSKINGIRGKGVSDMGYNSDYDFYNFEYNSYDIVSLDYKRHVMSKIGAGAKEGDYKEKNKEYVITIKK